MSLHSFPWFQFLLNQPLYILIQAGSAGLGQGGEAFVGHRLNTQDEAAAVIGTAIRWGDGFFVFFQVFQLFGNRDLNDFVKALDVVI